MLVLEHFCFSRCRLITAEKFIPGCIFPGERGFVMYVIACHGRKGYLYSLSMSPGAFDGPDLDLQFSYDQYIRFDDESEALQILDVLTDIFDDENFIILEV